MLCWWFCGGASAVLVLLWWCGGGGSTMVVLRWWCGGGGSAVVVLRWWCFVGGFVFTFCGGGDSSFLFVNMENYNDPPMSLTLRKFSDDYSHSHLDFRRRVWESHVDGSSIIGEMLIDKIGSEEFYSLRDKDDVGVCLLTVLHMVLLGQEPKNNVPDWWLRLVDDPNMWEKYPCGSYIWPKLYVQLKDANVKRWYRFYASQRDPRRRPAKYTLSGFTWAFKTWILEAYKERALKYYRHEDRHPGAAAWFNVNQFFRVYLEAFFEVTEPIGRLRPDAFEVKAEWWVSSRAFFDGRICEQPQIPPVVRNDIYQRVDEQARSIKELQQQNDDRYKILNSINKHFEQGMNAFCMPGPMKAPVEVPEDIGLSDFSGFQMTEGFPQCGPQLFTTQASSSFFEGAQMTPTYPGTPILGPLWHNQDLHRVPLGILPHILALCSFDDLSSSNHFELLHLKKTLIFRDYAEALNVSFLDYFRYCGFFGVEVTKLTTGRLVNGSSCDGIVMVIKNLDLEPKDIIAKFCGPSRWKELSKESGSKILPCGDGSCYIVEGVISSTLSHLGSVPVPKYTLYPFFEVENVAPKSIKTQKSTFLPPGKTPTTKDEDFRHQDLVLNRVVDKKGAEGDDKLESQWTPDERRVVVQDQRLKSIIMSCLPDDIMESVISCETAKATWTDLVHSFEGPSDTKENRS
ncbi:hypothetical protein Tco_0719111 [Tanacetum coccineum]